MQRLSVTANPSRPTARTSIPFGQWCEQIPHWTERPGSATTISFASRRTRSPSLESDTAGGVFRLSNEGAKKHGTFRRLLGHSPEG